jgi:carbon-monoxide dehydrogenase large subunit
MKMLHGDVERGFAESDEIIEETYRTQPQAHASLEPHSSVAMVDPAGRLTIWVGTSALYPHKEYVAKMLGLPTGQVRVIGAYTGGQFGGKSANKGTTTAAFAGALARKSERPVQVILRRSEVFETATCRHGSLIKIKTGVLRDGRLIARQVDAVWDGGAYSLTSTTVAHNGGYAALGPYRIPNAKVDSYAVYTNKHLAGSFRGFGTPQVGFACESHMDVIAKRLGLDPLEFRLMNIQMTGDIAQWGEPLRACGARMCLEAAAKAIGWDSPPTQPRRALGIGVGHKGSSPNTASGAYVRVEQDGSVQLLTSVMDPGGGEDTVLCQIAAEELRVPMSRITVVRPDTDATPYDFGTVSSRITYHAGNAVRKAAGAAREKLLSKAAEMLEVAIEDIEWADQAASVRGAPDRRVPIGAVAKKYFLDTGGVLVTDGYFRGLAKTPDAETGFTERAMAFWMYCAQAADVEVDPETGEVRVSRMAGANDAGKAVNPLNVVNQIEGGLVQGLGYALSEDIISQDGVVVTTNFRDYPIPRAMDSPPMLAEIIEEPDPEGPYGAKGISETGLIPTAAVIANGIERAVGVRVRELPITSEKVYQAIKAKESAAK